MNSEDFYIKLKKTLLETTSFPTIYMFKFILPNINERIEKLQNMFNHLGAVIEVKPSKNGNYASISIKVEMKNAEQIIEKYKEVSAIKDVISL